ncbi:MAG: hypothetical protein P4M11_08850 [Candidatus Pacebacteria bacterium]|nr:hypothetical protein [Candidatus Paceibacterota bacterium]
MNFVNKLLYEDCISTLLYGESLFWREKKDQLKVKYPLERAEEVARKITDFGPLSDNSTILDKFRVIITQLGNALG